ncbi:MAG: tetratricopeptide repeat protein, partial [Sphingobacteriales bacterium]
MKKLLLNTFLTLINFIVFAQTGNVPPNNQAAEKTNKPATRLEDSLHQNLANAKNPYDLVKWQGELAQYYIGIDNNKSDELGKKMLETAESSRDKKLIILAMLKRASNFHDNGSSQEFIRKGTELAQKALDIARNSNLEEQMAWAYIYLSRGARANGEIEKALNYSNHAMSLSSTVKNDSLKVSAYNSLGNSYLYKKEKLLAYRNYLAALDLAEQGGKYELIRNCYMRMIDFNRTLENWDRAKDYQFRLDSMARKNNRFYDVLNGYNSMGALYAGAKQYDFARMYYDKAIALSDTLDFKIFKLNSYISIVNLYLMSNQYKEALAYFDEKTELRDYLNAGGMGYLIDQGYGSLYTYVGKYDSASYYFKKAEPYFETYGTKPYKFFFYSTYSDYFKKTGNFKQAIHYWEKAEDLGKQINSFDMIIMAAANLDSLNTMTGDYEKAYSYKTLHTKYKDSVDNLTKEKD